jgi:hypothetical protein
LPNIFWGRFLQHFTFTQQKYEQNLVAHKRNNIFMVLFRLKAKGLLIKKEGFYSIILHALPSLRKSQRKERSFPRNAFWVIHSGQWLALQARM